MAFQKTYDFNYFLDQTPLGNPVPIDENTLYPAPSGTDITITDDRDGSDDGVLAEGALFSYASPFVSGFGSLLGVTANGDPVVEIIDFNFGGFQVYYVLSDNPNLTGPIGSFSGSSPVCFAAGTEVSTPQGSQPVETLRIGDKVTTQQGHVARVRWVGRQTFHTRYAGGKLALVRVRRGALGAGLPNRDLALTADHALLVDGLLVNAGALVNHTSITFEPLADLPETVTVYHVETDNHDLVLANGVPAETFIDYVGRSAFDNFDEYLEIYGAERIIREMAYPRISARRMVPGSVWAQLNGKRYTQDEAQGGMALRG